MAESSLSQVCVVLGSQWGDEGKGKIVDVLSQEYDVCARYNGGSNAGHTIVVNDVKYAFHLLVRISSFFVNLFSAFWNFEP